MNKVRFVQARELDPLVLQIKIEKTLPSEIRRLTVMRKKLKLRIMKRILMMPESGGVNFSKVKNLKDMERHYPKRDLEGYYKVRVQGTHHLAGAIGEQRYRYKVILLVYDVRDRESFEHLRNETFPKLIVNRKEYHIYCLVGNNDKL